MLLAEAVANHRFYQNDRVQVRAMPDRIAKGSPEMGEAFAFMPKFDVVDSKRWLPLIDELRPSLQATKALWTPAKSPGNPLHSFLKLLSRT